MTTLCEIADSQWDTLFAHDQQQHALEKLEQGYVLTFPQLAFELSDEEQLLLTQELAAKQVKQVSYFYADDKVKGVGHDNHYESVMKNVLRRYVAMSTNFVESLLFRYHHHLHLGHTSFYPAEIDPLHGAATHREHRLHVDAFAQTPTQGQRILRLFTNIDPHGKSRVWELGEPFRDVAIQFAHKFRSPLPFARRLLKMIGITKSYRTLYDHYMLQLQDAMTNDDMYQRQCDKTTIEFQPGSSWLLFTDAVPHAALNDQHILEQTFYLPVRAMVDRRLAPLSILEDYLQEELTG